MRRLVALAAGLGIAGALVSQQKTGLLPEAHAATDWMEDTNTPCGWFRYVGSTYGTGLQGSASTSSGGQGVLGLTEAAETGGGGGINYPVGQPKAGVHGASNTGYGVYGESRTGTGVYGETNGAGAGAVTGHATSSTGQNAGVSGFSDSTNGYGVYGSANATSGNSVGVYGQSNSTDGFGVEGYAPASGGVALWGLAGNKGARAIVAQGTYQQTANLQEWWNSGYVMSVVDAAGQFGIGTATPARMLHIRGSNAVARLDRDVDSASFIFTRTAAGNFNTVWKTFTFGVKATGVDTGSFFIGDMHTNVSGSSDNRILIDTSGNVGIGTTTPSSKLHVAGRVKALGYDTGDITFANGGSVTEDEKAGLAFKNPDGEKIAVLDWNGNFHIKGKVMEDL